MEAFDVNPNKYDQYEDLTEISEEIRRNIKLTTPKVQDLQMNLQDFSRSREKRKYSQDWAIYYSACRSEKLMAWKIIKDAVDYLGLQGEYKGNGRPSAFIPDIVKSLCIKAYCNLSSWRIESELRLAKSMGIIDTVYKKTSINKYMASPNVTKILHKLYTILAEPIAPIETQYAIDATGISNAYKSKKWVEVRLDRQEHKDYNKLHVLSGTITNVVVSAKVTEGTKHESPFLKELVKDASKKFPMREISADAGYLSRKNCDAIKDVGAIPFILPKKNTRSLNRGSQGAWGHMIRLWRKNQMLFAQHYHQRSNVESTFGAMKRKFGDFCRCKMPTTQENEIISRIVCYNACVLAEAMLSNDLEPVFMSG